LYVRSEVNTKETLPSAIMGEYTVTELFEDKIPLFTVSPQMGNEAF